jgi:hypothetical protein
VEFHTLTSYIWEVELWMFDPDYRMGTYFLNSNARWLSLMSLLASAPYEFMLLITTVMMGDG